MLRSGALSFLPPAALLGPKNGAANVTSGFRLFHETRKCPRDLKNNAPARRITLILQAEATRRFVLRRNAG